jgi:hypothetical protein
MSLQISFPRKQLRTPGTEKRLLPQMLSEKNLQISFQGKWLRTLRKKGSSQYEPSDFYVNWLPWKILLSTWYSQRVFLCVNKLPEKIYFWTFRTAKRNLPCMNHDSQRFFLRSELSNLQTSFQSKWLRTLRTRKRGLPSMNHHMSA